MSNHNSDHSSNSKKKSKSSKERSVVEIVWTVPGDTESSSQQLNKSRQQRTARCIDLAVACTKDFNTSFEIYNEIREKSIPPFHSDEIVLTLPAPTAAVPAANDDKDLEIKNRHSYDYDHYGLQQNSQLHRVTGFYKEYILEDVQMISELKSLNDKTKPYYTAKEHFINNAKRLNKSSKTKTSTANEYQFYSLKLLQDGILETDHGPHAITEMMIEVKILCSISNHPHIMSIYGIASSLQSTIGTTTSSSTTSKYNGDGYFFITDRIHKTLKVQIDEWKTALHNNLIPSTSTSGKSNSQSQIPDVTKRLEMVLDIASALIFLHDRQIVYYIRPDKIGFDYRYNVIKLCSFGQCRQHTMDSNPRSITQSDNINVLAYSAPEIFCMAPATKAIDVYGIGIILWEMISLQQPFAGYDRCQHYENIVRNHQRPLTMNNQHDVWDKKIAKIIHECLHPYKRPTMKKIHDQLEYKLLYQEPNDEIIDTAQKIQRRHSESMLEQIIDLSQIKIQSNNNTHDSSMVVGNQPKISSTGDVTENDETHGKYSNSCDTSTFNASGTSILSSMSLNEMLHEVSARLGGGDDNEEKTDVNNNDKEHSRPRRETKNELNGSRRNRGRVQTRRSSTAIRRSRSNSIGPVEVLNTKPEQDSNKSGLQKADRSSHHRSLNSMANIDDEEELIASIMSQNDANSVVQASITLTLPNTPALKYHGSSKLNNSFRVMEVRRSLVGGRSPVRLRARSTSRSVSRSRSRTGTPTKQPSSLLNDGTDRSEGTMTSPGSVSSTPRIKISPDRVISQNASRQHNGRHVGSTKSSDSSIADRTEVSQRSQALRKSYSRSDSDGSLGIRRRRRASVAEVKEKFDFVPDANFKKSGDHKNLNGLKQAIEKASSPRRWSSTQQYNKEKYHVSPTKNVIVQASKTILNGVFRRNSAKDVEPEQPVVPIHRRQIRRNSASLVQDLVLQQNASSRSFEK